MIDSVFVLVDFDPACEAGRRCSISSSHGFCTHYKKVKSQCSSFNTVHIACARANNRHSQDTRQKNVGWPASDIAKTMQRISPNMFSYAIWISSFVILTPLLLAVESVLQPTTVLRKVTPTTPKYVAKGDDSPQSSCLPDLDCAIPSLDYFPPEFFVRLAIVAFKGENVLEKSAAFH